MTPYPKVAELDLAQAEQIVEQVRGVDRPRYVQELKDLYSREPGDLQTQAEVLTREIALQQLDQYLMSVLRLLTDAGRAKGWESLEPCYSDVEVDPSGRFLVATVELAYTPENHECVHGPCTSVPVIALAAKLLGDDLGELNLVRITWVTMLKHTARLAVWRDAEMSREDVAEVVSKEKPSFFGSLQTRTGALINFAGWPLEGLPIRSQLDYHGFSRKLLRGQRFEFGPSEDELSLAFCEEGLQEVREALRGRPEHLCGLLLDLPPIAILNWRKGRHMLDCGFSDVDLAGGAARLLAPGTRMDLRYRPDRSHFSKNSGLWIGYYEFRYTPGQTDWSATVMAETDSLNDMWRRLHSS